MKLTPIMQRYVVHWGEMGTRWGVNRSISQIHALLYLTPEPLTAESIAETLDIARSNVSTSLRELQRMRLARMTHELGDRRDYFTAHKDNWELVTTILEERKHREIDPTLEILRECVRDSQTDQATPPEVKKRIGEMLNFLESLSGWYEDVRTLPRPTLMKLMKMGARVGRFVSRNT